MRRRAEVVVAEVLAVAVAPQAAVEVDEGSGEAEVLQAAAVDVVELCLVEAVLEVEEAVLVVVVAEVAGNY